MNMPRAKKSLGQHFLKNEAAIARIVRMIQPAATDQLLEIGPGPGALTARLRAEPLARLLLIEKDAYWAAHHAALCPPESGQTVICGDALAFGWDDLQGPWKVVGNLPYNVASPLIWDIVSRVPVLARAVFMVQKEVAERLYAAPGGRDYGALSVWVQSFVRVEWGFVVGPGSFAPPPKVDSAVVAFAPLPARGVFVPEALSRTLKLCFGQRRKQLQSVLRNGGVTDAAACLAALGIDPVARPETLSVAQFQTLAAALYTGQSLR